MTRPLLVPAEEVSAVVSQAQITFLRSFKGKTPFALRDDVAGAVHTVPFRLSKSKVLVRGHVSGPFF